MRTIGQLGVALFAAVVGTGCVVTHTTEPPPPVYTDGPYAFGSRGESGYYILANGSVDIPRGGFGFAVTANGASGFRIVWTDTLNSPSVFSGTIETDGIFSGVTSMDPAENVQPTAANRIDFSSIPGSNVHGIDLNTSRDPIYVDVDIDGSRSGFPIYFRGAYSGAQLESAFNPVAFTTP